MRRTHLAVLALFASAGLAPGITQAALIVEDFEGGTVGAASATGDAVIASSSGGSGGSAYGLQATRPTGGWGDTMAVGLGGALSGFATNTQLQVDIRAQGGSDVPGWWLQVIPILNLPSGWVQGSGIGVNLDGNWATYTWDFAAAGVPATVPAWGELRFNSQGGAGGDPPHMTFFIDNIQLIPEPASAALVGLAGLAMRRRRR